MCSDEIIPVNYNLFMGVSPFQTSRCSDWMILAFEGIQCVICVFHWAALCSVGSPSLSFPFAEPESPSSR